MNKGVMSNPFCSFERKSNLDFSDVIPSLNEADVKDLLSFSISKKDLSTDDHFLCYRIDWICKSIDII